MNETLNRIETELQENANALFQKYSSLKNALLPIHESVVQGASLADGGLLTGHGPAHIARVGAVAASIVDQCPVQLSDYEKFILLVAIQIHDIANITGREKHEKRIPEIWKKAIAELAFDAFDKSLAEQIASAHGGKVGNDRNTIGRLEPDGPWNNEHVRPRFLAALLRVSDELAEDPDRSARTLLALGQVPRENEIFHIYAGGLHSIAPEVSSSSVRLKFAFNENLFLRPLGKGSGENFLLDEIYSRAVKTWLECIYCSRFFPGFELKRVHVEILIFGKDDDSQDHIDQRKEHIRFYLEDDGYPSLHDAQIFELSKDIGDFRGGGPLTAQRLIELLKAANTNNFAAKPSTTLTGTNHRGLLAKAMGLFKSKNTGDMQ
ncbi:MAG: hypothetical protein AAF626_02485 [Pseudomonadota bacterium]